MRPIDADAAKSILNEKLDSYPEINGGGFAVGGIRKGLQISIRTIGVAPTLDYAPVKHGKWNNFGQISRTQWLHRCNLCGCPQDYNHNYCPNCGAKMDGGKKDGNQS